MNALFICGGIGANQRALRAARKPKGNPVSEYNLKDRRHFDVCCHGRSVVPLTGNLQTTSRDVRTVVSGPDSPGDSPQSEEGHYD